MSARGDATSVTGETSSKPTGGPDLGSVVRPTLSQTRTSSQLLTEDIGFERNQVKGLGEEFDQLHHRSFAVEWRTQTALRAKDSTSEMLGILADLGFAWRDIARLVGVSVPAVKKWRRGEGVTGENRHKVASLVAFCDLIIGHYAIHEIASWFEMPIVPEVSITALDLYQADRADLIFRLASGYEDPERIVTDYHPHWRSALTSSFETFRSADGMLSIRPKE